MGGKIIYRQQYTRCGKERCRKCREGEGHGPYWYAYWNENGRTKSKYIGLQLPPELAQAQNGTAERKVEVSPPVSLDIPASTVQLRIYVLGQFRLEHRQQGTWQIIDPHAGQHRRARALLGCLLSSPGRKVQRDQALKLLWPDQEQGVAANRLNGAVHELRALLEPELSRPSDSRLLRLEHATLELADSSLIWVDADAFEQALKEAERVEKSEARGRYKQAERLLEEAAALYKGSYLLEDLYAEWAMARREELQKGWIELHLKLARLRIRRRALSQAIESLSHVRTVDPLNEYALRLLMVLLTRLHRRGEALQLYQQYLTMLKREYEAEPLAETRALYEELCQGLVPSIIHFSEEDAQEEDGTAIQVEIPVESAPLLTRSPVQLARPVPPFLQSVQTPFVDRQAILERMRQSLSVTSPKISPAMPRGVLLTGVAGSGKTRLAQVVACEAYRRDWAVLWSRSTPSTSSQPYYLWRALLAPIIPELLEQADQQKLAHYPWELHVPRLLEAFQHVTDDAPHPLQEALLQTLFALSQRYPLLLVLDDLQLADAQSLEMLSYLLYRVQQHPIMLLLLCREDELTNPRIARFVSDAQHKQSITLLSVPPMSKAELEAMLAHLPACLVQRVCALAIDNPLFAETLARHLMQVTDPYSQDAITLPEAITALFRSQLSRLSQPCQKLLAQASQFGSSFALEQLMTLTGMVDEDATLDLLDEALKAKLLTETSEEPYITYHYWHPLLGYYLRTVVL